MDIFNNIRSIINNEDNYIYINNDSVFISNYKKINVVNDDIIKVEFQNFSLSISGKNFFVKRMNKREILFSGIIYQMEFLHE